MADHARTPEDESDIEVPIDQRSIDDAGLVSGTNGALLFQGIGARGAAPGELGARLARSGGAQHADAILRLNSAIGNRAVGRALGANARRTLARQVDPRLAPALEQIRTLPLPLTLQARTAAVQQLLSGIDLSDPDNAGPFLAEVERDFLPNERGAVISAVLAAADTTRARPTRGPTAAEEAEMQRRLEMLQVPRRGPYGQVGPGVLLPELSQAARPLLPLVEAVDTGLAGAGAFANGLLDGLSASIGAADRDRIREQLVRSTILNTSFPLVFVAGAIVGIVEDVVDAVKGIWHLITDFSGFLSQMRELLSAMFGPDSRPIGQAMGQAVGREYGTRISALASANVFAFTFGIGRMFGPTIAYTVLGFLGVPEMLISALVTRLIEVLGPIIERFPRLMAVIERIAARLGRATTFDELDAELDRAFSATFTEHVPPSAPGAATSVAPEIRAGFQASQLRPLRRLLGRPINSNELADLGRIWTAAANPGEAGTLTLDNSRRLFNNHRGRFWRRVRQDAAAKAVFEDAGFSFGQGPTTAPTRRLADGSTMEATIDHIVERQTNPGLALDPSNLRISTRRENTVLLRQLHAQDPFLAPPPAAPVPAGTP